MQPPSIAHPFASLAEIATLINADADLDSVLQRIVFAVCRCSQWDTSSIMSVDEERCLTVLVARYDPQHANVTATQGKTWNLQTSPALEVLRTGKPVVLLDVQNDPSYPFYRDDARERDYASVVLVPLPARDRFDRPMVMTVQSKAPARVDQEACEFLQTVAHLAAIAVDKARRLADEQALSERLRQTVEVAATLMQMVLSDVAASHVLDVVERLLGHAVCVTDLSAAVVLSSERTRADAAHADVLARIDQQLAANLRMPVLSSTENAPFLSGRVYALEVDGERVGELYLLAQASEIDALDTLLLEQVRFALSVLLMRSVVHFKSLAESQSHVLAELTSGQWRTQDDIRARAASVDIHVGTHVRLVAVDLGDRSESLAQNHRAISFLVGQSFAGGALVMLHCGAWLLWLPVAAASSEQADEPRLKILHKEIEQLVGQAVVLAVGPRCENVQDYATAWQTCQRALQLAMRFARTGVVQERDFGADALILAAMSADAVRSFQHDRLTRLAAFDARNGSELLNTVDAFLRSNCKLQHCANALSIHVTTLRHRLERLRDVFGVDFDDPEQRFSLQLALRLRALGAGSEGAA